MKKIITENQIRKIVAESLKNILKEGKWFDDKYNEDFTPDELKGNFEAYVNGGSPIMGTYKYHVYNERQTYDYPGYSEVIIDNISFIGLIPQDIKDRIKEELQDRLNNGESGDITIEI